MKLQHYRTKILLILLSSFLPCLLFGQSDFWVHTNESPFGEIDGFAFTNGNVFTFGNGVYRSTNGGKFWSMLSYEFNFYTVHGFVMDNAGNMYAGTGNGFYFSPDMGSTWSKKDSGLTNSEIDVLTMSSQGILFAGTRGPFVFKSTDKGITWEKIAAFSNGWNVGSLLITNEGTLLAGVMGATWIEKTSSNYDSIRIGGIYRSTNGGISWDTAYVGLVLDTWGNPTYQLVTSLCKSPNGLLYAGAMKLWSLTEGTVLVSTDDGKSWTATSFTQPVTGVKTNSRGFVFATTRSAGIFRSSDGGTSWTMVSDCANPTVAADENGIVWAASSGLGGIANSTDNGNSWVRVNEGLMDPDVMCLAFDSRGTLFAGISQGGGIAYTTDNGETWVGSGLSTSDWIDAITATDTNNLLATGNNSFYKSTDKAKTWSAIPFPSPNFYVYSFYQSGPGEILAASNQGVLSSTTNGDSWTSLLKNSLNNFSITCDPNGWIFVGTDSGVFLSINHGANWTAINNGLTNTDVRAMTMLPDGKLFAGTWGGGIFRSTDKGGTWVEYNSGLTGTYVQSFGVNTLGDVFAGISGGGVCRSRDDGSNWEPINSGLTFLNNTRALAVSPTGYLFAGTFARGVYRSVSPTTTVNELPAPFPSRFELAQNFPNPFNPATTIRYQVSQRTRVVLTVFDLLGRKVMNLVDNIEEPGLKTVRFDATGLSTGIYLYRMQAGSYNQTRKFILLK